MRFCIKDLVEDMRNLPWKEFTISLCVIFTIHTSVPTHFVCMEIIFLFFFNIQNSPRASPKHHEAWTEIHVSTGPGN